MNRAGRPPGEPPEAALKRLLEGPGMHRLLTAVLRSLNLRPANWTHLRSHHRPGAGITALYRVEAAPRPAAAGSGQPGPGRTVQLQVGATTGDLPTGAAGTVAVSLEGTAVRLWVHPRDPVLAGLPWATNAAAVARDVFSAQCGQATLSVAAYRPLRRAVVRADCNGARAYLKVPQPRLAAGLRQRLEQAAAAGLPVPALLAAGPGADAAANSVLILDSLPGNSLHTQLAAGSALDPDALIDLLDRLPAGAMGFTRRPAWADRVLDYAGGAVVALPAESARIARCAREIAEVVDAADPGPPVPSHGDFHGGNLLATGGGGGTLELTGLLDVDALGPGHRVDDLACFLGHLRVLSGLHPENAALQAAAARCAGAFARRADPAALYGRSAAVALTLVAGASGRGRQAAERALVTAEDLLASARAFS